MACFPAYFRVAILSHGSVTVLLLKSSSWLQEDAEAVARAAELEDELLHKAEVVEEQVLPSVLDGDISGEKAITSVISAVVSGKVSSCPNGSLAFLFTGVIK